MSIVKRFSELTEPENDDESTGTESREQEFQPEHFQPQLRTFRKDVTRKSPLVNTPKVDKVPRIVPIFLKDKTKWGNMQKLLNRYNVQTIKCKLVSSGIQITSAIEGDYRQAARYTRTGALHLPVAQQKTTEGCNSRRVQKSFEEEMHLQLLQQEYPARKITKMNGRDGNPVALLLVEIARDYESIFNLANC